MKRAAGIIMSAVMVLSMSSCSLFDIPSEKSDGTFEIALEDTKKETIETTVGDTKDVAANIRLPGDIDLDLEETVAATVAGFGCGYKDFLNLEYMESSLADKNMEKSIRNYAHVWHSEGWPKSDGTSEDIDVNFYVFELDTSSDEYAALETGGKIDFFYKESVSSATVTAINGQYVLCIHARQMFTNGPTNEETLPDFKLSTCQKGYEAFLKLGKASDNNDSAAKTGDLNISLIDVSKSVFKSETKKNSFNMPDSYIIEKGLANGIKNFTYGWVHDEDYQDKKDYEISKVMIFEVDTSSDQYKELSSGGFIFYYENGILKASVISAINGQYVLCIDECEYKDLRLVYENQEPDFKSEDAKTAYENFKGLK